MMDKVSVELMINWIACSDRLPDKNGDYYVIANGKLTEGYFNRCTDIYYLWDTPIDDIYSDAEVSHWTEWQPNLPHNLNK